jgi:hypothetical protein
VKSEGWIGVDLDGTLAEHEPTWSGTRIGAPIEPMVTRVKRWLSLGKDVRILTARVHPDWDKDYAQRYAIYHWSEAVFGIVLPVTCQKDPDMLELWDDRAITIVCNTGMTEMEHRLFYQQTQAIKQSSS